MSVMTAAEQKRRAGAARGRRAVTAVPGQPNVMAGPWPGAGELPGRTAHAAPGRRHAAAGRGHGAAVRPSPPGAAGTTGPQPPAGTMEAALPAAAQVPVVRPPVTQSPVTQQAALPGVSRPGVTRSPVTRRLEPMAWPVVAGPAEARPQETGARPVRTRVRLTRRGRIVVAVLITASMVLVAALAWLAGTAKADVAGSGVPSSAVYHSLRSVVVMPGQSLWSIATQYEPTADPRSVIQEIIDLNALSGTSVQPGERLWLPRG
jgi:hypothetical protein